jgi:hypothetical protein
MEFKPPVVEQAFRVEQERCEQGHDQEKKVDAGW